MSITNKLNQIKNAIYGKEVRGAIHDAIKECYDDASVNHDNANMEVKMARGTHNTLNDRLDNVDEIQAQTNAQLLQSKQELSNKIQEVASTGTTTEVLQNTTESYIQQKINDGTIANLTIEDNSITPNKVTNDFLKIIKKPNVKVRGQITKLQKSGTKYVISTSDITLHFDNGGKLSFAGVSDYTIGETVTLYADLTNPISQTETYQLQEGTHETLDMTNKICVFSNWYGKFDTDLQYDITLPVFTPTVPESLIASFSPLISNPMNYSTSIEFNPTTKVLSLNGEVWIKIKASSSRTSIRVQAFNLTLRGDDTVVYIAWDDVLANSVITSDMIKQGSSYGDYIPSKHFPLFWYSKGLISTALSLPISIKGTSDVKKGVCLGDSLTQLNTLPEKISELTGYEMIDGSFAGSYYRKGRTDGNKNEQQGFTYVVDAISSGDWSLVEQSIELIKDSNPSSYKQKIENLNNLKNVNWTDVDFIQIFLGTNDAQFTHTIGDNDSSDVNTVKGAMNYGITKLLTDFPHIKLYLITPMYRNGSDSGTTGTLTEPYCQAIEDIGNKYGIPVKNLYHSLQINEVTKNYYLSDGLHQNSNGNALMADVISKFLKSF